MPITLGILAQSRQAVAASDFVLLETQTLGSSQFAIEFTNLGTKYSSLYKHLQLRIVGKSTAGVDFNIMWAQFNGDTAANYSQHNLFTDGAGPYSNATTSTDKMFFGYDAGVAAGFGGAVVDILDAFVTTKTKTIRSLYGSPNQYNLLGLTSGNWRNTNALTSIRVYHNSGDFAANSRISLYGVK